MPSLFQVEVESFLTTPPTTPANASRWLVKPTGVGAFAGQDNNIATFNTVFGWAAFERAKRGWIVFVKDVGKFYTFDGSSWMVGLSLLSDDAPLAIGTAAPGTMPVASRADHVHQHGAQTNAADHQVASDAAAGFMSGPDKTKLGTIASGADVSPVRSVHSRTGAVVGEAGDYSMAEISGSISMLQHGAQTDGGLHGVATASKAGFMSGPDKTRLDALGSGVPASIAFALGNEQSGVTSSTRLGLFTLQYADQPNDWSGYALPPNMNLVNQIVCQRAGKYAFDVEYMFETTTFAGTQTVGLSFFKNGSPDKTHWQLFNQSTPSRWSMGFSGWMSFNSGDRLELVYLTESPSVMVVRSTFERHQLRLTRLD